MTPFTVTKARSKIMTFMEPVTFMHLSLIIKNPSETYNLLAYIEPMRYLAWAFVMIFILVAPPVLYLAVKYV